MTPLPLLFLLTACIENSPTAQGAVDVFDVPDRQAIDVLLVVDNSSSMEPYQARLGANFTAFISSFVDGNVDYHIAVTTTDDGNDANVTDPARGAFVGTVITADMDLAAAEAAFAADVNVGSAGTGLEVGMKTAWLALTDRANLRDQIDAFLRDDAGLSIVFMSDEEDQSPWSVAEYVNAFWDIKGRREWSAFNASALTMTDRSTCQAGTADYSTAGTRYVDLAAQTHGASGNLCSDDFGGMISELSLANTQVLNTYFLRGAPEASSITVTVDVDGEETDLPCESGAWIYDRVVDSTQPAIVFDREHLPAPGGTLSVRYILGDGNPEGFCGEKK